MSETLDRINKIVSLLPTSPDELKARLDLNKKLDIIINGESSTEPAQTFTENGVEYTYYVWNDGGGQALGVWFTSTGLVCVAFYDHETALNFYALDDAEEIAVQYNYYKDLPEELRALFINREETYEWLNVTTEDGTNVYATCGVLYLKDAEWILSPAYLKAAEDKEDDGGIGYCTGILTFEKETLDDYETNFIADNVFSDEEVELEEKLKAAFNEYRNR